MIEGTNPVPPKEQVNYDPAAQQRQDAKLKDASKQFEQAFIEQLFKQMRKTEGKDELFGGDDNNKQQDDTFKEMLDQQRAKAWTDAGGIGMAQIIYEQMRNQVPAKAEKADADNPMTVAEGAPGPAPNRKTDPTTQKE